MYLEQDGWKCHTVTPSNCKQKAWMMSLGTVPRDSAFESWGVLKRVVKKEKKCVRTVEILLLQLMPILRSIFGQETTSEDLGLTFTIRLTKGRRGQTAVSRLLARPQLTLRPTMGAFYVGQTVCVSPGEPLGETLLFVFITERGNSTSRKAFKQRKPPSKRNNMEERDCYMWRNTYTSQGRAAFIKLIYRRYISIGL